MLTAQSIFERYQQVRPRMPAATTSATFQDIASLITIADQGDAFVFDAFGVLNVGDTMIEGADARVDELRALGCQIRILTNAASYDRAGAVAKFKNLGIHVLDDEIITSRDATLAALSEGYWGVIAAPEDMLSDIATDYVRLGAKATDYDAVDGFLFLSSSGWNEDHQRLLSNSLSTNMRPVLIANADLVAPRDTGFSLEPGYFGHLLADQGITTVRFFGKPFPQVYDLIETSLQGVPSERIIMCGDTLHTDVLGAAARGWKTVLVTEDGLFAGHDTEPFCRESGLFPDWRLARI
jgi:HAD superfamily hydrolase (TIGR01450 family)